MDANALNDVQFLLNITVLKMNSVDTVSYNIQKYKIFTLDMIKVSDWNPSEQNNGLTLTKNYYNLISE